MKVGHQEAFFLSPVVNDLTYFPSEQTFEHFQFGNVRGRNFCTGTGDFVIVRADDLPPTFTGVVLLECVYYHPRIRWVWKVVKE